VFGARGTNLKPEHVAVGTARVDLAKQDPARGDMSGSEGVNTENPGDVNPFAVSAGLARGFWVELFRAKDAKDAEGGVGLATEDRDFIQVCAPTPPASDT